MLDSALPKYIQLKNELQKMIDCGDLPPNSLILPENEMTTRFQVSRVTVRAALKELESEGYISRERGRGTFVKEIIKPKQQASHVKEITVMCESDLSRPFTSQFFTELSNFMSQQQHDVVFRPIGSKPIIQRLQEIGINHLRDNGLVLINDIGEDVAAFIHLNKIPFVALGAVYQNLLASVEGTQATPVHWAVEHLLKQHGKKRLALFDGWPEHSFVDERLKAFEAACRQFGIWHEELVITQLTPHEESRMTTVTQWLEKNIDFDAALCYTSSTTSALLRGLETCRQRVPDTISLITIEDTWLDPQLNVKLTKIQPDIIGMAAAVADIIITQLTGTLITWNRKVDARIIIGESCGC